MGSFRSVGQRKANDTAWLGFADRPAQVPLEEWLAEGESIRYWTKLPHGARGEVDAAANPMTWLPSPDGKGQYLQQRFDPVAQTAARLRVGIVQFKGIADEKGAPIDWDPGIAGELLEGLPAAVLMALSMLIDSKSPARLGAMVDRDSGEPAGDGDPDAESEGNASPGSSGAG